MQGADPANSGRVVQHADKPTLGRVVQHAGPHSGRFVHEPLPDVFGLAPHVLDGVLRQLLDSHLREGIEGILQLGIDEIHHCGRGVG